MFGVILLCVLGLLVAASIGQIEENSDRYQQRLEDLTRKGAETLAVLPLERLGIDQDEAFSRLRKASTDTVGSVLVTTTGTIMGVLSQGTLVLIFLCFLVAGGAGQAGAARGMWADVEIRIKQYLVTKILLSAATGLLVGLILLVLGIDLWLIFGLFAFLLNFIPTLGSIIATLLPLPIVVLNPDVTPLVGVLAIALPATVQMVIGNILEPKMMGKSLQLHPIAILMALIVWGMVWGIIGALLAVPMTAIVKIMLERSEVTAPAARLLEGKLRADA
jgi:AI-2 transport protein TqsA